MEVIKIIYNGYETYIYMISECRKLAPIDREPNDHDMLSKEGTRLKLDVDFVEFLYK